jgi:hypothetical protein
MASNVNGNIETAKTKFLQPGGSSARVGKAIDMIQQKTKDREEWGQKIFAKIGMWFFPVLIVCLTTAGVGGLLCQFLPSFMAYPLAGILAVLIEMAQAAFGRPLMKRLAKGQEVNFGQFGRVVGFTLLSIALGALAFYHVFLETETAKLTDNRAVLAKLTDSVRREYQQKETGINKELSTLNHYRAKRWGGMLTPEERNLSNTLNNELLKNDSLKRAEIAAIKTAYPIEAKPLNWKFSPENLIKIIGSLLVVVLLGFLTIYSHYVDFCYAKAVADESSAVLGHDGQFGLYDEVATAQAQEFYLSVYSQLPGYEQLQLPGTHTYEPARIAPAAKAPDNKQPVARSVGFRIGDKQEKEEENEQEINKVDANSEARYSEPRYSEPHSDKLRTCDYCGKAYEYKMWKQRFCSKECNHAFHHFQPRKKK